MLWIWITIIPDHSQTKWGACSVPAALWRLKSTNLARRSMNELPYSPWGVLLAVLLSDNSLDRQPFRGNEAQYEVMCRACRENRDERYVSMAEFYTAWMDVR